MNQFPREISQYDVLRRWHQQVQQLNEAMPIKAVERKMKDGTVRTVYIRPKCINANTKATGERIIKDYVGQYLRSARLLGDAAFADPDGNAIRPGLLTNTVEIGDRRSCSDRTARLHVRKLQKVGLVSAYKFHGTRHDFELWVDPVLLWGPNPVVIEPVVGNVVQNAKAAENQVPKIDHLIGSTEEFSAYKVTLTQGTLETEKKADRIVHSNALNEEHGDENHGNTEQQQPNRLTESQLVSGGSVKSGAGGAGAGPVDNPKPAGNPFSAGNRAKARLTKGGIEALAAAYRTPQQHQAILEGYLSSFWRYAKQQLYSGHTFADYEESLILNAIQKGVYRNFEPVLTEKEWDRYQTELYAQIDMAASYYARHQGKWVPMPYAQYREGAGYFDRENERGFSQTRVWLKENQRLYKTNYVTQQINLAVRHLQLHRADKAPKTLQQKTYIEAFRHLETKIGKYGQVAQDRFRNLVATIGQRKPKLTPGFTKNFKN